MKTKIKLFLSLIWRDATKPFSGILEFYKIVLPGLLLVISMWVVFLDLLAAIWPGASWKVDLSASAYTYIALYAIGVTYKWLKLRWDQLPDKTP